MKNLRQFTSNRHPSTPLIVVICAIILVAGSVSVYAYYQRSDQPRADSSAATNTANTTSSTSQSNTSNQPSGSTTGNTADDPKANVSAGATGSTGATAVTITSVDQSVARKVSVSAYASTVVNTGTCTFSFTKDGAVVTRTTDVLQNASSSSCDTLTIDTSSFPSLGTWQLVVSFQSGNITGQSASQTVVIK